MIKYLLDSSALWRLLRDRKLHESWHETIADGEIASCYPQRTEVLTSARNLVEFDGLSSMFTDLYGDVAVPKNAGLWIGGLQRRAADAGCHQALSAVDLQLCATAAHHGLVVLHDDRDFVTASRLAVELSQHNVHDGPRV
uniref:PIN domain-containing protein n=1 Tax=Streptomyces tabacisoli TaxID=3156398 RepID=UPI003EBC8E3F